MGRQGSKQHRWTEDELRLLQIAVEKAAPMLEHYDRQGYTETDWWSSVAGMLFQLGGPVVTGKACARQHELWLERIAKLEQDARDTGEPVLIDPAWEQVKQQVEQYEQGLMESLVDRIEHLERGVKYIAHVIDAVARELGIKETWE